MGSGRGGGSRLFSITRRVRLVFDSELLLKLLLVMGRERRLVCIRRLGPDSELHVLRHQRGGPAQKRDGSVPLGLAVDAMFRKDWECSRCREGKVIDEGGVRHYAHVYSPVAMMGMLSSIPCCDKEVERERSGFRAGLEEGHGDDGLCCGRASSVGICVRRHPHTSTKP